MTKLLLCVFAELTTTGAWAQLSPTVLITYHVSPGSSGGDTQYCTWTGPTTLSGPWNGGALFCDFNDGQSGFGCTSRSICNYQMLTYDASTPSAAFSNVNTMDSYGTYAQVSCYDGAHQMKSRHPFSLPGYIFQPIYCMSNGQPYHGFQSGLVVSPDGGKHWCNYKTFQAGGTGGVNTCDSGNWKATGDNPVDPLGFQWPLADGTNLTTRMQIIDFLCQDQTVNCPNAPGVDSAYLYFATWKSDNTGMYIARVQKSLGPLIILASNWTFYSSGSWVGDSQSATDVSGGTSGVTCCDSVAYLKDFGVFALLQHAYSATQGLRTAPYPWGPWTQQANINVGDNNTGFPSFVPGLCPKYTTPGRVTCTVFMNGVSGGSDLYIREYDLGPVSGAYSGLISYGQSLSNGASGTPIISTTQPYRNLCLSGDFTKLVSLTANGGYGSNCWVGGGNAQESPVVSFVNNLTLQSPANGFIGIGDDAGVSGLTIAQLDRPANAAEPLSSYCANAGGQDHYCGVINEVLKQQQLSLAAGHPYVFRGIIWTQGEADFLNCSHTYYQDMLRLHAHLENDLRAALGNPSLRVPFIFKQLSFVTPQYENCGGTTTNMYTCPDSGRIGCLDDPAGAATPLPTIAQWKLQHDHPYDFYLAGPGYQYNSADHFFHLDNVGYNKMGATYAAAGAKLWVKSPNLSSYAGVFPASISISGPTITASFYTPNNLCLNTDTATVPNPYYSTGNYDTVGMGFQFYQQGGTALSDPNHNGGITAVSVGTGPSCRTVTITLSGTPNGTNQRLWYAFEGVGSANSPYAGCSPDATTCNGTGVGPSRGSLHGNIRTVTDYTDLHGDAIQHWLIHFNEPIGYSWAGYSGMPAAFQIAIQSPGHHR
jgi:hypothetical protein